LARLRVKAGAFCLSTASGFGMPHVFSTARETRIA